MRYQFFIMNFYHSAKYLQHTAALMRLSFAMLLALAMLPVFAQKKQAKKAQKAAAAARAQQIERLKQHVYVLASDSLEGRRTGTPGEAKAVDYLVRYYQQQGIAAPASTGYIQPFVVDEGKLPAPEASLQLGDQLLKAGTQYFPLPFSSATEVMAPSAVALPETGSPWWINLTDSLELHSRNPHMLYDSWLRGLAEDAAKKGASAVLFYTTSQNTLPFGYNPKDRAPQLNIPVWMLTPEGVQAAGISTAAMPLVNGKVAFVPKTRTGTNVLAFIDNHAATTIILGAHLDHLGYGEDENSRHTGAPAIHNGADDNASGTAALMELGLLLKLGGSKNFNYLLAHFSGEELGLYGSKYLADHLPAEAGAINYMMNMDMVGRLQPQQPTLTIGGIGTSPTWGSLLPEAASLGMQYKIDSSGTGPSDHTSFYRKDLPVLFFFTGLHTDYHKPEDDAEKLNYEGMAQITGLLKTIIDNSAPLGKLAFQKTREQSMGGNARFKVSLGIMPDYTFSGTGVRADGVIEGRAAQKAGVQTGDIIMQLGDHLITGMDTYMEALGRFQKGDQTKVVIKRGADVKELPVAF